MAPWLHLATDARMLRLVSTTPIRSPLADEVRPRAVLVLAALTMLFALRVVAQLIQRAMPQRWLPPFEAFQGSSLAYPTLLAAQAVILAAMIAITARVARRPWIVAPAVRRHLAVFGWIYFSLMAARLAIGMLAPQAGAWFTAWISAVFHLVLAAFVLAWAACLRPRPAQVLAGASG